MTKNLFLSLFLLVICSFTCIYFLHQKLSSNASESIQSEYLSFRHIPVDHAVDTTSSTANLPCFSNSKPRVLSNKTFSLPGNSTTSSIANIRIPPHFITRQDDPKKDELLKEIRTNFPMWETTFFDQKSCRVDTELVMRELRFVSTQARIIRYQTLVDSLLEMEMCMLVQLFIHGGIFLTGEHLELGGMGLIKKLMEGMDVLSIVIEDNENHLNQALLGAPAGHPLIHRAVEIFSQLLFSNKISEAVPSIIAAIEEVYDEQAPLNVTRLACKGVHYVQLPLLRKVNEAKINPQQPTANQLQKRKDFEPDLDEETLSPNVTMLRTMLMNGRDDDGQEFPPRRDDLCHANPVEGAKHDYVRGLREAMIRTTASLNSTTVKISPWNHFGKDKSKQKNLIEVLAPKVMCLIYTVEESHSNKVNAIRNTWAGGCDGFLAFSSKTDLSIPAIAIRHKGPEKYNNMWQKVRSIWKYVAAHYINDYDWFHLGGDDMFVLPQNLKTYLASLAYENGSPREKRYFVGRRVQMAGSRNHFNSGGPGYTMSQATLREFVKKMETGQCSPGMETSLEDFKMGECIRSLMISLTDTRDAIGRERYHIFDPGYMLEYRPPERVVGEPVQGDRDWFENFNNQWGLMFGSECCAPDSVSFHYVPENVMRHMHALLNSCPILESSYDLNHSQSNSRCSLVPASNKNTTALFRGDSPRYEKHCIPIDQKKDSGVDSISTNRVEVVISFCNPTNLDWLYWDVILQIPDGWNVRMNFISICGAQKINHDFREYSRVDEVNVIAGDSGGQDYSYVKFVNDFIKNPFPAVIFFAKERKPINFGINNFGGYKNASEMINFAANFDFGCGIKPGPKYSWYHDRETLQQFMLDEWKQSKMVQHLTFNKHKYENLGDFHHRALNYSLQTKYVPVCYGGSFAVHSKKILDFAEMDNFKGKSILEQLELSLRRNDRSIIEEHFVERSWASFFSDPLLSEHEKRLELDTEEVVAFSQPTAGQIKLKM